MSDDVSNLQVCIPVGCVPSACWPYPVVSRGVSAQGGEGVGGLPGGMYPSMQWVRHPPPRTESQTVLKTLPCPKLRLRVVIIFLDRTGASIGISVTT